MRWAGILNKYLGVTGELVQGRLRFALWRERGVTLSLWPAQPTGSCSCHNPSLTVRDVTGKQDCLKQNVIKHVERIKFCTKATLFGTFVAKFLYLSQQPQPAQIFQKTWSFFSRSSLHIIVDLPVADSIVAHRYQARSWSTLLPRSQGTNNPTYGSSM